MFAPIYVARCFVLEEHLNIQMRQITIKEIWFWWQTRKGKENFIIKIILHYGKQAIWKCGEKRLKALNIISVLTLVIDVERGWKEREDLAVVMKIGKTIFLNVGKLNYGHLNTFSQFPFNSKAFLFNFLLYHTFLF